MNIPISVNSSPFFPVVQRNFLTKRELIACLLRGPLSVERDALVFGAGLRRRTIVKGRMP